jgi:hypothetical protein
VAKEQLDAGAAVDAPGDDSLRCVVCEERITERGYRREMAGAHEHMFVNPAGFSFVVGCFVAAPGCAQVGMTTDVFSWFPGWTWQVAICRGCSAHVGWIFRCGGEQFHGLITTALH